MDQVKSFDGLDIGKGLLVKSVELCIHGSTSLVIIPHTPKKRSGKQCAERYSKQCEQRKDRIIVKYDCESTDKNGTYKMIRFGIQFRIPLEILEASELHRVTRSPVW